MATMSLFGIARPPQGPVGGQPEVFVEDVQLMRRVAQGDPRAERLLVSRLAARCLRIARSFVISEADAHDLVQDGLIEVFRSAASYRGESPLESWADRILVRRAVRFVRRVKEPRSRLESDVDLDVVLQSSAGGEAPETLELLRLQRWLAGLDVKLQQVARLRFIMGYTVPEIGDLLNTSQNTIKKRLLKVTELMRALLRESGEALPRGG